MSFYCIENCFTFCTKDVEFIERQPKQLAFSFKMRLQHQVGINDPLIIQTHFNYMKNRFSFFELGNYLLNTNELSYVLTNDEHPVLTLVFKSGVIQPVNYGTAKERDMEFKRLNAYLMAK